MEKPYTLGQQKQRRKRRCDRVSPKQDPAKLAVGFVLGDRDSSINCDSWAASDVATNVVSLCSPNIQHIYPCPKFPEVLIGSAFNDSFDHSDSWWANEEINNGVTGWHFDLCCSDNEPDKRMTLKNQGICPDTKCELNPGASFCIESPAAICEGTLRYPRMITNQCCYSQDGDLIEDATSGGAGSLNSQRQSMNNIIAHYDQDIQPKSMCCIEETDKCSVFASVRTVSVGNYRGSMIISASFGGHFINANGSQYHFVGLGVYDLATIEFPTSSAVSPSRTGMITIQISTRPYGESSVISGFVLKDTLYKIELFRLDDTVTAFFVNDVMTVFPYSPYKVGEFEIDNKMAVDSTLTIRDLRTGMVVSASVISKFISLYVGIPSYLLDITIGGLLGYSNHPTFFVEAQNRTAQNASDLHDYLDGEYKLSSQSDWLFNNLVHDSIAADISSAPDSVNYEVPLTAYESFSTACNGDENCIADSHFTGDDATVAQAYAAATLLKVPGSQSQVFSELYRAYNTPADEDPEVTIDSAAGLSIFWQLTAGCVLVVVSWFKIN
ncbi:uncharacterized protein LOC142340341 [Convolutriloba macropyga]|uniref:uncharacterized protein LOC142340341 n=1 Tax=Convolutriloba macropyga TaxID=536237 RepID=UPI003F527BEE